MYQFIDRQNDSVDEAVALFCAMPVSVLDPASVAAYLAGGMARRTVESLA